MSECRSIEVKLLRGSALNLCILGTLPVYLGSPWPMAHGSWQIYVCNYTSVPDFSSCSTLSLNVRHVYNMSPNVTVGKRVSRKKKRKNLVMNKSFLSPSTFAFFLFFTQKRDFWMQKFRFSLSSCCCSCDDHKLNGNNETVNDLRQIFLPH